MVGTQPGIPSCVRGRSLFIGSAGAGGRVRRRGGSRHIVTSQSHRAALNCDELSSLRSVASSMSSTQTFSLSPSLTSVRSSIHTQLCVMICRQRLEDAQDALSPQGIELAKLELNT